MGRPRKTEVHGEGEAKPLFALKQHKRPSIPKYQVAMREETHATFEQYIGWASEVLEISSEEAQSRFMEFAVSEIINKDSAFKAHVRSLRKSTSSKGKIRNLDIEETEGIRVPSEEVLHQVKEEAQHKGHHKK